MIADTKHRIAISITKEQLEALQSHADGLGITKSAVLQIALVKYLESQTQKK